MKKSLGFLLGLLFMCSISSAAVLDDAIGWMYDNWLTIHDSKTTFNTNRWLRRDEAAKFFVNYAKELNQTEYVKTADQCVFSDINNARSDLRGIVVESCRLWLFQWSKWMFNP